MYICHVEVHNFRALHSLSTPLKQFSVLLGENDVGKTSFLHALDRFFVGKKISDRENFFDHDEKSDITIALTFSALPSDERLAELTNPDGTVCINKTFSFNKTPTVKAILNDKSTKNVDKEVLNEWFPLSPLHVDRCKFRSNTLRGVEPRIV